MNALTAVTKWGEPLFSKLILAAIVVAMLFAALPVPSAFAAPAGDGQPWENVDMEGEWKGKLRQLQVEGLFYNQVRFYPADFEDSSDLARAWDLLHKHGFALKQANTIVFNHSGFDFQGNVINERRAYDTVHDLGMYLHAMRGLRMKIAEAGYKVQRVRQPS
jgi:hypothetical protein